VTRTPALKLQNVATGFCERLWIFDMQELFQLDVQISYKRIEKSLKCQVTSYSKAECALNQHFMRFGLFLQSMWTMG
jgi:hypothetical protein